MLKPMLSPIDVVDFLNQLLELDREFVSNLVATRYPVNSAIAEHPTVQVLDMDDQTVAGFLGVINGMFGTLPNGSGPICAVYEGDDEHSPIQKFALTGIQS